MCPHRYFGSKSSKKPIPIFGIPVFSYSIHQLDHLDCLRRPLTVPWNRHYSLKRADSSSNGDSTHRHILLLYRRLLFFLLICAECKQSIASFGVYQSLNDNVRGQVHNPIPRKWYILDKPTREPLDQGYMLGNLFSPDSLFQQFRKNQMHYQILNLSRITYNGSAYINEYAWDLDLHHIIVHFHYTKMWIHLLCVMHFLKHLKSL